MLVIIGPIRQASFCDVIQTQSKYFFAYGLPDMYHNSSTLKWMSDSILCMLKYTFDVIMTCNVLGFSILTCGYCSIGWRTCCQRARAAREIDCQAFNRGRLLWEEAERPGNWEPDCASPTENYCFEAGSWWSCWVHWRNLGIVLLCGTLCSHQLLIIAVRYGLDFLVGEIGEYSVLDSPTLY